jgi:hypothetical protein
VRIRTLFVLLLGLLVAKPAFASRTILYYENECCRYITEGEFAILYVEGSKLKEPAQGWTVQSAAAALSSLGHQPQGGWVLSRFLSEAVMARLLKNSSFYRKPFTDPDFQKSDTLVTIARARSAMPTNDGLTQGEFAILLAEALKLSGPPSGWSMDTAIAALSSQPVPIRPAAGWKPNAQLREGEMMQILALTQFRPTSIDPNLVVSTLQAYSLLFGKFEIATQGNFGLFIVNSLGVPPPPGGWTADEALKYIKNRFGVDSGYGWSAGAPLCAESFNNALRQIVMQLQPTTPVPRSPQPLAGSRVGISPFLPGDGHSFAGMSSYYEGEEIQGQTSFSGKNSKDLGRFLDSIRKSGLGADPCAIIPANFRLAPEQAPCPPCASPPCPPCP